MQPNATPLAERPAPSWSHSHPQCQLPPLLQDHVSSFTAHSTSHARAYEENQNIHSTFCPPFSIHFAYSDTFLSSWAILQAAKLPLSVAKCRLLDRNMGDADQCGTSTKTPIPPPPESGQESRAKSGATSLPACSALPEATSMCMPTLKAPASPSILSVPLLCQFRCSTKIPCHSRNRAVRQHSRAVAQGKRAAHHA